MKRKPSKPLKIIPVKNPPTPAVAYEDDTHIIVEVDETLSGKRKNAAVLAALRVRRGGLGALLPLPVLLTWELTKEWARAHPVTAGGGAVTTAVTTTLGGVVLLPSLLNGETQPRLAEPAPPIVITVTASGSPSGKRSPARPTTTKPVTLRQSSTYLTPAPTRARSTPPGPTSTIRRTPTPPSPTTLRQTDSGAPLPSGSAQPPPSPVQPPESPPIVDSSPPPTLSVVENDCSGLIELDLSPIADVCLLG